MIQLDAHRAARCYRVDASVGLAAQGANGSGITLGQPFRAGVYFIPSFPWIGGYIIGLPVIAHIGGCHMFPLSGV